MFYSNVANGYALWIEEPDKFFEVFNTYPNKRRLKADFPHAEEMELPRRFDGERTFATYAVNRGGNFVQVLDWDEGDFSLYPNDAPIGNKSALKIQQELFALKDKLEEQKRLADEEAYSNTRE